MAETLPRRVSETPLTPASGGKGAEPAEEEVGAGRDAGQKLACVRGAQHVDRLVRQRLRGGRIERHMLVVELAGVLVQRGEKRGPEAHIGHVDLHLAELMVEHGVGVRSSRMLEFKRLDEDFFSED